MAEGPVDGGCLVDIVLCIDVTASMGPVISQVKQGALSFHTRLESVMAKRGMAIGRMRLRVVAFRDFGANRSDAMELTPFYTLPQEAAGFEGFVRGLKATGGGDVPESGLEALAMAVQSPWSREPHADGDDGGAGNSSADGDSRHIIVLFTDAAAHPLGKHTPGRVTGPLAVWGRLSRRRREAPAAATAAADAVSAAPAPSDAAESGPVYPQSLDELHDQWGRADHDGALMDQSAKRLLVFAPEATPWREIAESWDKTLYVPSTAGTGLEDIALDEVIATIARSL